MKKTLKTLLVFSALAVSVGVVSSCDFKSTTSSISQPERQPQQYSGNGAPEATLGENGDIYTNVDNNAIYQKISGSWSLIQAGDVYYVVTFNLNGGQFSDGSTTYASQNVREGRWITAPSEEPSKEHSTFLGWYAEGSETKWSFTGTGVYGDVTLVAKYEVNESDKLTVTINPNNGSATYTYDTFIGDYYYPSIPNYTGYDFVGWFYTSSGEQYNGYVTSDLATDSLYAKWEKSKFNVKYYVEQNDEVTITGLVDIFATTVTVPNTILGKKVTKISSRAFQSRNTLVSVTIPANVKVIEDGAFAGTTKLTTINVDSANLNYTSVDGILFTKDMTKLCVYPTKAGSTYSVPATVKEIGAYAFYDTKDCGISSITFNEGLEVIGKRAFSYNETITSLKFPSTLKRIEDGAFFGMSAGDDDGYVSPQGVVQTVDWGNSIEEIGYMAFVNQYFQDTFELPKTLKTLGDYAFANCTAITKLVINENLEDFGANPFAGCTGILDLDVAAGCTNFAAVDGVLYNKDMTKLVMCPSGRTELVTVPEGVEELCDYAFYMVDQLNDYEFPTTLKRIGEECFAHTYDLNSFVIPDTVEEMGINCFDRSGLSEVTISANLTEIPEGAFIETGLSEVTIPANVKKIADSAFRYCSNLKTVTFNEGLEIIDYCAFASTAIEAFDMPTSLRVIGESAFSGAKITNLVIKQNFESLGLNAFLSSSYATTIKTITVVPTNNNFSVKQGMLMSKDGKVVYFASSSAGTQLDDEYVVTFPNGVEKISNYAFSYCKTVTEFNFPSSLVEIGEGAFYGCKFEEASIPASVKIIGAKAFSNNFSLEAVQFNEGLEEIGEQAFYMTWLDSVAIPDTVKKIGAEAFSKTMAIKTITLGKNIEEIGDFAFADNKATSKIVIPASVTSIGIGAFSSTVSTYGSTFESFEVDANNANYSSDGTFLMDKNQTVIYAVAGAKKSVSIPNSVVEIADYGMACSQISITSLDLNNVEMIGEYGLAYLTKVASLNVSSTVSYIGTRAFEFWTSKQSIRFGCTREYAYAHFASDFLTSCNAVVSYFGE